MLVFLGSFVLMLEPASLQVLGQASFFSMIVAVMLPPTFAVQLFIFIAATLVVGQCLGWAWGCAAMAASLRARDVVLAASQVQRAQAGVAGATNPDVEYRREIFEGVFLQWQSTLVHGCFLAVGLFALGLIRVKAPKLMLLSIFASIVLDIMCSYGPYFPVAQYTLATTFLIPTACYLAIAIAGTLLIFPETLNYSWTFDLVDKFLGPVLQRSHLHSRFLATAPPSTESGDSSASAWSSLGSVVLSTQEAMSSALEGLLGGLPMLELEVSYGRLSAKDLKAMADSLRELHARSVGLAVLYATVVSRHQRLASLARAEEHDDGGSAASSTKHRKGQKGGRDKAYTETSRMRRVRERFVTAERANNHDLDALLPLFEHASRDLRAATDDALQATMAWLSAQNDSRWAFLSRNSAHESDRLAELQERVQVLERLIEEYRQDGRSAIVEPFRDFFDPETGKLRHLEVQDEESEDGSFRLFAPGSLFTVLAASDNLVVYSAAVLSFSTQLATLAEKRRRNKVWWPTGLRKIGKLLAGRGPQTAGVLPDGDDPDRIHDVGDEEHENEDDETLVGERGEKSGKAKAAKKEKTVFERAFESSAYDPEARPPRNAAQRASLAFYHFLRWWFTPDAIFALKYVAGSICIWLFGMFQSTAFLAYSQKSLWTLITFQDSFMACWYLGSANGNGTRPGVGAALFVLSIPLFAIRLFAPPTSTMLGIMTAVTAVLVVGYSWQDTHLPTVGNPGVGYNVAWRRALLVIIGAGVAFVFMIIPPQSSRRLVRRTHATCIEELGRIYTAIVSAWLSEDELHHRDGSVEHSREPSISDGPFSPASRQVARARMLALRVKLNSSRVAIEQAAFELSLRGDWPKDSYHRLLKIQLALLQAFAQLGQALIRLDHDWRSRLVHETAFLNQPLISLALRQGCPLPEATPGPLLDRLLQHDHRLRILSDASSPSSNDAAPSIEGARVGDFVLTWEVLRDERFGTYASALQALASILLDADELEKEVKLLVGETSFPGYGGLMEKTLNARA
ncbi:hypothetical protein Rhopal_006398-T1 [Rhodotorula paludigena]|uniref:ER transporter 6TM N-terminal domain-containing protein n=1 Tax=Rhodotorula paludigena TaxID=86838 RepID=A0AAV5GV16_9BASI|nr:hypothetical protein Rhopal_006398-T1 [Rhodotorula paludigena]